MTLSALNSISSMQTKIAFSKRLLLPPDLQNNLFVCHATTKSGALDALNESATGGHCELNIFLLTNFDVKSTLNK